MGSFPELAACGPSRSILEDTYFGSSKSGSDSLVSGVTSFGDGVLSSSNESVKPMAWYWSCVCV